MQLRHPSVSIASCCNHLLMTSRRALLIFSIRHVPKLGYRVGEMSCSRCTDVVDALRRRPSTRSLRPLSAKSHRHLPRRPHPVGRSSSDGTGPNDINSISRRYASRESPSLLTVPRRTSPDLASRCCSALS